MSAADIFSIPHFLKAGSPEALRLKMLENNLALKAQCQYFDISYDGTNWVVWYYKTASESSGVVKKNGDK